MPSRDRGRRSQLCGKCHVLKGRSEETLYADYIDGKRSYMDITLEIRNSIQTRYEYCQMSKIEEKCTPTRVDENKQLKLFSAFQMMHDCDDLWIDSEPYAKEVFEKEHRAQLLAARQVDIIRVPELREKLTISTSIYECKPLFGFRNDIIRDEQGEPCYVSYSMGAFIDLQTAKLSPLPQEMIDSLTMDEKYPMEYCDRRVRLPKVEPTVCASVLVTRDDIDYNHHMNNCCYIRIAQELIPSDFNIKRVRVEYKVAARQGEELTPLVYVDDNKYYIELKCERGTCAVIAFE